MANLLQLHQLQHLRDALGNIGLGHAVLLEAEGNVLLHRHMREERIGLEHHIDGAFIGRRAGEILPVEDDLARSWLLEARQHPQQC